jgi:hypothetical protein
MKDRAEIGGKTKSLVVALTFGVISNLEPFLFQLHEQVSIPHDQNHFQLHYPLPEPKAISLISTGGLTVTFFFMLSVGPLNRKD